MMEDPKKISFLKKIKEQFKELEEDLEACEARAAKAAGTAKAEYVKDVHDLRRKKEAFDSELRDVSEAGDEAWETLIDGLKKKANELKFALERMLSRHKPQ